MPRRIALIQLAGLLALAAAGAFAQDSRPKLLFCAEDENSYPWILKDGSGLNITMIRMVEARLNLRIEVDRQPWRRCLRSLQEGTADGAFKASYRADRREFGVYPMVGNAPDNARRMLTESYHFYRLRGTPLSWDGQTLRGLEGAVGAQAGFSVAEQLRGMKLPVDDQAKSAENILGKLALGRIGAAALQTNQADRALAADPLLQAKIERVEPPLDTKAYYLMLSHQFVERQPGLAEQIWATVAQVRESPEYKAAVVAFR